MYSARPVVIGMQPAPGGTLGCCGPKLMVKLRKLAFCSFIGSGAAAMIKNYAP